MIVYMATDQETGAGYIGVTSGTMRRRQREHLSCAANASKLVFHRALAARPDAFVWREICRCDDREMLLFAEKNAIEKYKTHATHGGYNMTTGGSGVAGFRYSDESRRKLSESGKARAPRSEETRRRLSEANKGKRPSDACLAASAKRMGDPDVRAKIGAAKRGTTFTFSEDGLAGIRRGARLKAENGIGAKIHPREASSIHARRAVGERLKDIAATYGCTASAVCYFLKRNP